MSAATATVNTTIHIQFAQAISGAIPAAPEPEYYLAIRLEDEVREEKQLVKAHKKDDAVLTTPVVGDFGIIVIAAVVLSSVAALAMAFRERKKK